MDNLVKLRMFVLKIKQIWTIHLLKAFQILPMIFVSYTNQYDTPLRFSIKSNTIHEAVHANFEVRFDAKDSRPERADARES